MAELEEKLNALLNDPNMMQQLMSMAQSMGASQGPKPDGIPDIDPGLLKKISLLANQGSIDKNQQTLLKALHPYLSQQRIRKLERAMKAAHMAKAASGVFNSGLFQL